MWPEKAVNMDQFGFRVLQLDSGRVYQRERLEAALVELVHEDYIPDPEFEQDTTEKYAVMLKIRKIQPLGRPYVVPLAVGTTAQGLAVPPSTIETSIMVTNLVAALQVLADNTGEEIVEALGKASMKGGRVIYFDEYVATKVRQAGMNAAHVVVPIQNPSTKTMAVIVAPALPANTPQ